MSGDSPPYYVDLPGIVVHSSKSMPRLDGLEKDICKFTTVALKCWLGSTSL